MKGALSLISLGKEPLRLCSDTLHVKPASCWQKPSRSHGEQESSKRTVKKSKSTWSL